jgi:hypothetical protein
MTLFRTLLNCLALLFIALPTAKGADPSTTTRSVTFERDIEPLLARLGCNAGACHGKARGQNGFALSLLGFDPEFDYAAITKDSHGRRVFPANPEFSLLLRKASGQVAHGGGKRLPAEGPYYDLVRRWIVAGCPRTPASAPSVTRLAIEPPEATLAAQAEHQLHVTAHFSDGSSEDVTHLAMFQSSESVFASVSADGLVKAGSLPGEAAIMARFREKFAVANVLIPLPTAVPADTYARLPRRNFIDGLVWDKLRRLNIVPSPAADEATVHRRLFLDLIGRLPTPEETRNYLADPASDKRAHLIDRLLDRPEYADFWANKWADLLRPNPYRVGIKAVFNLDAWLREVFRRNEPYDQFVRDLLTARGSTFNNGAAVIYRDRREPAEIATMASQLFLGIRLECARCHHHPFENWSQDDFFSFAAFFAGVGHKGVGLSPPISGGEEVIHDGGRGQVRHPVSDKVLSPRPLFGEIPKGNASADARHALADWVTAPGNQAFARVIVNRVWTDLMGRGMVEPVDDLRASNPPSNGPLLDALAADFRTHHCDLKSLLRTIAGSYVYGLSSRPEPGNVSDARNYSRHYRQRLRAEVLLDAVTDVTGSPETFAAMPAGSRAMEVWTARTPSLFLTSFGRPDPNQDPPCERMSDTTVVQALHLMNSPAMQNKLTSDQGRAAKLAASKKTAKEVIEECYLLTYSRRPTDAESAPNVKRLEKAGANRRRAIENLLWALMNTPEFEFKD